MTRTSLQIGKDFEKTLQSVFSALSKKYALKWHPFVDSHAAGNTVAAQPSDYLMGIEENLFFLEAKSSIKQKRFQRSMLRPAQRGAILFYAIGMKIPYWIIFEYLGEVHCLDGAAAMTGSRIAYKDSCVFTCKTEELEEELAKLWGLTPLTDVIKRIEGSGN